MCVKPHFNAMSLAPQKRDLFIEILSVMLFFSWYLPAPKDTSFSQAPPGAIESYRSKRGWT